MSLNYDGEYELRLFYTTTPTGHPTMQHRHTFDIRLQGTPTVGDLFSAISVVRNDAEVVDLELWLTVSYLTVWRKLLSTSTSITHAELWHIPEGTYNGTFISTFELGLLGTTTGDEQAAQQATATFRTLTGGIARLQTMEGVLSGNARLTAPYVNTDVGAYMSYVTSAQSAILGRDNSKLVSGIAFSVGHNEKLWRKRFRSN